MAGASSTPNAPSNCSREPGIRRGMWRPRPARCRPRSSPARNPHDPKARTCVTIRRSDGFATHVRSAAAAVRAGEDLEVVAAGVGEVAPAAAVAVIDLVRHAVVRIRPERNPALADATEDLVELGFAHQERV